MLRRWKEMIWLPTVLSHVGRNVFIVAKVFPPQRFCHSSVEMVAEERLGKFTSNGVGCETKMKHWRKAKVEEKLTFVRDTDHSLGSGVGVQVIKVSPLGLMW